MFLGHFAAGLAGKRAAPPVSLGTLILAAQFIDLLWPTLLLLGVEQVAIRPGTTAFNPLDFVSYPFTHSLLMVLVWGVLLGGVYYAIRRNLRGAVVLGVLVLSHWALDLLVHRPDLPLAFGDSPELGLGLWNSVAATLLLETVLFGAGVFLYLKTTTARDRTGVLAFWGLVAFLVLIYAMSSFGPPPADAESIAWAGHAQWLFVAWGYWVDRHRDNRISRPVSMAH